MVLIIIMNEIWINLEQALNIFKENEIKITKNGLYFAGKKFNFIKKANDNFHYLFNKNGVIKYIKEITQPVSDEWISILDTSNNYDINIGFIYKLIKDKKIKCKTFGRERINYILKEEIEDFMNKNKEGYLTLEQITKFYNCSKTILLKVISSGKLKTRRFSGDLKLYAKEENIRKLFKHRETNQEKNNG